MSNVAEQAPDRGELLSTEAVRLAEKVTGGPAFWFLWQAGSGQELLRFPHGVVVNLDSVFATPSGLSMELGARLFEEAAERWRETPRSVSPKQRRTPLGRRIEEIRAQIKASGQPLLSWEDIDQELAELRGEKP